MSRAALAAAPPIVIDVPRGRTLAEQAPSFLRWLQLVRRRKENTARGYGEDLKTFLDFCSKAQLERPEQVTFRHLEFYLGWLQTARGLKPQSANRHLHALRTFWTYLCREGAAPANPAAECFMLPAQKKLPSYLTIPEQERLLAALAANGSPVGRRDHALVATALFTGLRCNELATLQVPHVNLDAGRLRVVNGKGGKDRELPIIPRLELVLRDYLDGMRPRLVGRVIRGRTLPDPEFVFVNAHPLGANRLRRAGQPILGRTIFHIMRRVVSPILGRPVAPHMLRHSFASRLRENGADLQIIQEALGHANINTTTMYAHLTTNRRRQELARLLE